MENTEHNDFPLFEFGMDVWGNSIPVDAFWDFNIVNRFRNPDRRLLDWEWIDIIAYFKPIGKDEWWDTLDDILAIEVDRHSGPHHNLDVETYAKYRLAIAGENFL